MIYITMPSLLLSEIGLVPMALGALAGFLVGCIFTRRRQAK
jgi:hypothetical protein